MKSYQQRNQYQTIQKIAKYERKKMYQIEHLNDFYYWRKEKGNTLL